MNARHLYVHVPFCARRCSYCAFSIAVRSPVPAQEFTRLLINELQLRFPGGIDEPLHTLYLGGGTPSHLGKGGVANLLRQVMSLVPVSADAEITLEANPDDVSESAVAEWREAGVNRVSLGVQSFSDAALSWMNRPHSGNAARQALATIGRNFIRFSADLIFALPDNVSRDLSEDVRELTQAGVNHISIYGLTAEPNTAYARMLERNEHAEAPEERYESEYLALHEQLEREGFGHYEVSSFAVPGEESRHNRAYWSGAAYCGIGPAAHGFDGSRRRWNVFDLKGWSEKIESGKDPLGGDELLTDENRVAEQVYLGLRTAEGLTIRDPEEQLVARWTASGWGALNDRLLRLTPHGWLRVDSLAADLTAVRSR